MTVYRNPVCLIMYAPQQPNHPLHPMIEPTVEWPVNLMPVNPVELAPDPATGIYKVTFRSVILHPTRIFAIGFSTDPTQPHWSNWNTVTTNDTTLFHVLQFTATDLRGATQVWLGSWFDNGTYTTDAAGTLAYFQAHPSVPGHHTVPVIITG